MIIIVEMGIKNQCNTLFEYRWVDVNNQGLKLKCVTILYFFVTNVIAKITLVTKSVTCLFLSVYFRVQKYCVLCASFVLRALNDMWKGRHVALQITVL